VKPADNSRKEEGYLKDKINELATKTKNKKIRHLMKGIN
jgi:hypothetical protein